MWEEFSQIACLMKSQNTKIFPGRLMFKAGKLEAGFRRAVH